MQRNRWTEQTIVAQIKDLHARGNDLSYQAVNRAHPRLAAAAGLYFGTYTKAVAAAGIDYAPFAKLKTWTDQGILQQLRELRDQGSDLAHKAMSLTHPLLLAAARNHFGTYAAALEAAGINYESFRKLTQWSKPLIIQELQALQRQGKDISYAALSPAHLALYNAARSHFGSYPEALTAAGIDPRTVVKQQNWTDQAIIAELQRLYQDGCEVSSKALRRTHLPLAEAARLHFGSHAKALEMAGIDPAKVRKVRHWDKQIIVEELRRWQAMGKSLTSVSIRQQCPALRLAARLHFGTYENALRAAGIDYDKIRLTHPWTKAEIIALISAEHKKGNDVSYEAMRRRHSPLVACSGFHFGSYRQAVEAAGIDYQSVRKYAVWDKATILKQLLDLHNKGKDLRLVALRKYKLALFGSAVSHFGSYRKAIEAAGLEYPPKKPLRHWSWPKVLQTLRELHGQGIDLRYGYFKKTHQPLFAAAKYYYGKYHRAVEAAGISYREMVAGAMARFGSARTRA